MQRNDESRFVPNKISIHFMLILQAQKKLQTEIDKIKYFNDIRFSYNMSQDEKITHDMNAESKY